MKTIILEQTGGVENLLFKDIDTPSIQENEVLIETKSLSINPVDSKSRQLDDLVIMLFGEDPKEIILGRDIAGVVTSIGSEVTKFSVGDRVFGMVNFPGAGNAYAEYVAAPEEHLATIPDNINFEQAAATTLAALTALQGLQYMTKGDRVLIHAGSGGVGHFAIQIAKHLGSHIITTTSSKNKDFVLSLGADEHIDYRTQQFEEVLSDVDFVLDCVGGEVLEKSLGIVKKGGKIVTLLGGSMSADIPERAESMGINLKPILVESNGDDMDTLRGWLGDGIITPHISETFPFENMGEAHKAIDSGRTVGKIVVNL